MKKCTWGEGEEEKEKTNRLNVPSLFLIVDSPMQVTLISHTHTILLLPLVVIDVVGFRRDAAKNLHGTVTSVYLNTT